MTRLPELRPLVGIGSEPETIRTEFGRDLRKLFRLQRNRLLRSVKLDKSVGRSG